MNSPNNLPRSTWEATVIGSAMLLTMTFLTMTFLSGCGKSAPNSSDNSVAQNSFDQGKSLMLEQKWEEALVKFDDALGGGVIGPDQVGEAYLQKALAHAQLGQFQEAQTELANAEQGADPDMISEFKSAIEELKRPNG